MKIRIVKDRKPLLLEYPVAGLTGKIVLGRYACVKWHIAIKADKFLHPSCIDFTLTNGRGFKKYKKTDTSEFSQCYVVTGGLGEFDVLLRWQSGHSPYPKIKDMEVWCFGVHMGNLKFPQARDDCRKVVLVVIHDDGQVTVDGSNAGIRPELAVDA